MLDLHRLNSLPGSLIGGMVQSELGFPLAWECEAIEDTVEAGVFWAEGQGPVSV